MTTLIQEGVVPEFGGSEGVVGGEWCVDLGCCAVRDHFRRDL